MLFFAAFRGSLFGQGRMVFGAFLNMVEQVLRFGFFLGLVYLSFTLEISILLNNLLAYIITTGMVFLFFSKELKGDKISELVFGYSIESRLHIGSVIIEHLFISIGIIMVYKMLLDERINLKFIVSFILTVILFVLNIKVFMWVSPFVIYPLGLAAILLVNRKLLLRDGYGS